MYNWQKWSIDLDFWQCLDGAIWSEKITTPVVSPHLSCEDRGERFRFLEGFEKDAKDEVGSGRSKVVFTMEKASVVATEL